MLLKIKQSNKNKIAALDPVLGQIFSTNYPDRGMDRLVKYLKGSLNREKIDIQNTNFSDIAKHAGYMSEIKKNEECLAIIVGKSNYSWTDYDIKRPSYDAPSEEQDAYYRNRNKSQDFLYILAYKMPGTSYWTNYKTEGGKNSPTTVINSKGETVDFPNRLFDTMAWKNIEKYAYSVYYATPDQISYKDQNLLDQRQENKSIPENQNIYKNLKPVEAMKLKLFVSQLSEIKKLIEPIKSKIKQSGDVLSKNIQAGVVSSIDAGVNKGLYYLTDSTMGGLYEYKDKNDKRIYILSKHDADFYVNDVLKKIDYLHTLRKIIENVDADREMYGVSLKDEVINLSNIKKTFGV